MNWNGFELRALRAGFNTLKDNVAFFGLYLLAQIGVSAVVSAVQVQMGDPLLMYSLSLGELVIGTVVDFWFFRGMLRLVRKEPVTVDGFFGFEGAKGFFWVSGVFIGAVLTGGLLVVPGIYAFLRYQFSFLVATERDVSTAESFRLSAEWSRGHLRQLGRFFLFLCAFNFVGLLCLVVGLMVTLPVSFLAWLHVYAEISGDGRPAEARPPTETQRAAA